MAAGGTLIYSPGHTVFIDSAVAGPIDVSADVSTGRVSIRENGSHEFSFTLENPNRKYDGLFAPNDRVILQLKRVRWLQIFAGYLDDGPLFSTYARPVELSAQCTLKVLKNWPWDEGSQAAYYLINHDRDVSDQDGGLATVVERLMNQVVGWPSERIHIGMVPRSWKKKYEDVLSAVESSVSEIEDLIGTNPFVLAGGYGSTVGTVSGDGSDYLFRYEDMSIALETIREMESGNNYTSINRGDGQGDWATGAYQFTDTTWQSFNSEYDRAFLAPPSVQDQVAEAYLRHYVEKFGMQLIVIPIAWYLPKALSEPALLNTIPAQNEGNNKTIRQYALDWIAKYTTNYTQTREEAPPRIGQDVSAPSLVSNYPIPSGITQLHSSEVGWGGYENGRVPPTALAYSAETGRGHPLAVKAWRELVAAADAAGVNVRGYMYRSYEDQVTLSTGMGATPGKSNHGWGLAIDITALTTGSVDDEFQSAEYTWLMANAGRFGWGHPSWAQQGGSKEEPWHWEFFAIYSFLGQVFDPETATPSIDPFASTNQTGSMDQLFSAISMWVGDPQFDPESDTLSGYKATMNDTPVMRQIASLLGTSGRSYCSAPNGDFMSWFPDYWGEFGQAAKMNIELIELKDFTVRWSDAPLITHQFVVGASDPASIGAMPGGVTSALQAVMSKGVATIEMPGFMEAIINLPKGKLDYPFLRDSSAFLNRFGARISRENITTIYGPEQEFWFAISKFTRAWASQFNAQVPVTFMPELWPGMLLRIPAFGVQFYVTGVSHSWSMAAEAGYTTSVSVVAPSAMDGSGFYLLPRGGNVVPHNPGAS